MTTEKKRWRWDEIWERMGEELDIADEDLVSKSLFKEWINDGIDSAEAIINTLHEEYFLTYQEPQPLEDGIDANDLPESIYASKIRDVILNDGTRAYQAKRFTDSKKFLEHRLQRVQSTVAGDEDLGYFLVNESESGPRIKWSPVPQGDTWSYEIWYYRQANRLVDDEDVCDIPEFIEYVLQWGRERVEWKRRKGSPQHMAEIQKLDVLEQRMKTTLAGMVIDDQGELEQDMSHYEGHN